MFLNVSNNSSWPKTLFCNIIVKEFHFYQKIWAAYHGFTQAYNLLFPVSKLLVVQGPILLLSLQMFYLLSLHLISFFEIKTDECILYFCLISKILLSAMTKCHGYEMDEHFSMSVCNFIALNYKQIQTNCTNRTGGFIAIKFQCYASFLPLSFYFIVQFTF